jgi:hypothetical protein
MAAPAVAPRSIFITDVITRTSLFAVPNQRHSACDGSDGTSVQFRGSNDGTVRWQRYRRFSEKDKK